MVNAQMFLGMTLCLPLAYWNQHQRKKAASSAGSLENDLLLATDSQVAAHY